MPEPSSLSSIPSFIPSIPSNFPFPFPEAHNSTPKHQPTIPPLPHINLHSQLRLQYTVSPEYLRAAIHRRSLASSVAKIQKKGKKGEGRGRTKGKEGEQGGTYPAFPIFTKLPSLNLPIWTRASNHCFRSPEKEPENWVSGSMECCKYRQPTSSPPPSNKPKINSPQSSHSPY